MNKLSMSLVLLCVLVLASCQSEGDHAACEAGSRCDDARASTSTRDGGASADASLANASASCERYLSCLLVVTPQGYAGALQLYGAQSACWQSAQTTANCSKACDAAFDQIASGCRCEGTVCSAPPPPPLHDACVNDFAGKPPSSYYQEQVALDCAISCSGSSGADCWRTCFEAKNQLSKDCGTCFMQHASCVLSSCAVCKTQRTSPDCTSCVANRCTQALETCSGLVYGA
ncbi:MAG: hypothetical protein KC503_04490 [Myxococcales bacterium]|nr:hypothetical protein [Myxococcales bacterium]